MRAAAVSVGAGVLLASSAVVAPVAAAESSPNMAALDRLCSQVSPGTGAGFFAELGRAFTRAPGVATNRIVRASGGQTSTVTSRLVTDADMNVRTVAAVDGVVTVTVGLADGRTYQRAADSIALGDPRYDGTASWQVSTGSPRTLDSSPWTGTPVVKAGRYVWTGTQQSSSGGAIVKTAGTTVMSMDCRTITMNQVAREYRAGNVVSVTRIKIWAKAKEVPAIHAPASA